jgi:hypothetical protein
MDGTSLDATMPATVEAMNANMLTTAFEPTGGVFICFVSGGTNQSGLIKIGSNARLLSVTLDIKSNKTCS